MKRTLPLLLLLAGCTVPQSATVSGKISPAVGHPKVGVITADVVEVIKAIDEFQKNSDLALATGSLTFGQVVSAKSDGTYTAELKSDQPSVTFALYAWNDENDNGKVDGIEGLSLRKTTKSPATNPYFYGFLKSLVTYQAIEDQNGTLGGIETGYDFSLPTL